jgi:molybdenum cofactor cytidylyltransferase
MIYGLIPAAGKSTRMGRPKLSLPLGDRTVLERVLDALRAGGIEQSLVVVGPHVADLVPLATTSGAQVCLLAKETPDMRATIERGLNWLDRRFKPDAAASFLLVPADHPALDPIVIRRLTTARTELSEKSIFIPTHRGRRGHPTLIGWQHVDGIRAFPTGAGLNSFLRTHAAVTQEIEVASADILVDLDTPADYESLRQRWLT